VLEPQFADDDVTSRRILDPVGPPWGAFALEGGEEITFTCRSFRDRLTRGDSLGCTLDLQLWVNPDGIVPRS